MPSYVVKIESPARHQLDAADPVTAAAEAVRRVLQGELPQPGGLALLPREGDSIRARVFDQEGQPCGDFDVTASIDGFGKRPTVRTEAAPVK